MSELWVEDVESVLGVLKVLNAAPDGSLWHGKIWLATEPGENVQCVVKSEEGVWFFDVGASASDMISGRVRSAKGGERREREVNDD